MSNHWMASVIAGSVTQTEQRFLVGDVVDVLNSFRLPKVEEVKRTATVERITESSTGETLYWLSGGGVAQTARTLRLVRRAR
jgi:hypothetical protein